MRRHPFRRDAVRTAVAAVVFLLGGLLLLALWVELLPGVTEGPGRGDAWIWALLVAALGTLAGALVRARKARWAWRHRPEDR